MIFATYRCIPGAGHRDVERVGETFVSCWSRHRSFKAARVAVRRILRRERWSVLGLEDIRRARRGDYPSRSDARKFFDEATTHGIVCVFHISPRYPVCQVDYRAVPMKRNRRFPAGTEARVAFLVVNSEVSASSDPFDHFWEKRANLRRAISLGRRRIIAEDWRPTAVVRTVALDYRAVEKDPLFRQYYDEAETDGDCLAFWPNKAPLQVASARSAPAKSRLRP